MAKEIIRVFPCMFYTPDSTTDIFSIRRIPLYDEKLTWVMEVNVGSKVGEKHTPDEWCKLFGVVILDPDGWRNSKISYDTPLTKEEFDQLLMQSTIMRPGAYFK